MNSITLQNLKYTLERARDFLELKKNKYKREMPITLTLDEINFIIEMINEVKNLR